MIDSWFRRKSPMGNVIASIGGRSPNEALVRPVVSASLETSKSGTLGKDPVASPAPPVSSSGKMRPLSSSPSSDSNLFPRRLLYQMFSQIRWT